MKKARSAVRPSAPTASEMTLVGGGTAVLLTILAALTGAISAILR